MSSWRFMPGDALVFGERTESFVACAITTALRGEYRYYADVMWPATREMTTVSSRDESVADVVRP